MERTPVAMAILAVALLSSHPGHAAAPSAPDTLRRIVPLPEVVVSTTRLDERAPVARATMARDEITRRNVGQDTPMLLATLPNWKTSLARCRPSSATAPTMTFEPTKL